MRTTQGERVVDVIYRRIDDEYLDPVQFRPDSVLGVAGLLNAARAGNVVIANAVGNGVADDKLVYTYLPDILKYYLGESTAPAQCGHLPLLAARRAAADVMDRLAELVVKPVEGSGGYGIVFGPNANARELDRAAPPDPGQPARLDRAAGRAAVDRADEGGPPAASPGTWTCGRSRSTTATRCSCCPAG